jgi:hypothetical protein
MASLCLRSSNTAQPRQDRAPCKTTQGTPRVTPHSHQACRLQSPNPTCNRPTASQELTSSVSSEEFMGACRTSVGALTEDPSPISWQRPLQSRRLEVPLPTKVDPSSARLTVASLILNSSNSLTYRSNISSRNRPTPPPERILISE